MDTLWAPWRFKYVANSKKSTRCIFCAAKRNSSSNFIIVKNKLSISMLNIFPYNNGHSLIFPKRHIKNLDELQENEIFDIFLTLNQTKKIIDAILKPNGYNIGINISAEAGAGIPQHLHIHLVPRWRGDTNFMPVIFNTKVVSQSLKELHKRIKYALTKYKF